MLSRKLRKPEPRLKLGPPEIALNDTITILGITLDTKLAILSKRTPPKIIEFLDYS